MDLKEEEILGASIEEHWYYRSKAATLERLLRPHLSTGSVLDVGAGSGYFAHRLVDTGFSRDVTCVDIGYPAERDDVYRGADIRYRIAIDGSDADLALLMDVLEHMDDDAELLRQYARLLGPGRWIAITAPAFQFLWSGHDVFLEHRR